MEKLNKILQKIRENSDNKPFIEGLLLNKNKELILDKNSFYTQYKGEDVFVENSVRCIFPIIKDYGIKLDIAYKKNLGYFKILGCGLVEQKWVNYDN